MSRMPDLIDQAIDRLRHIEPNLSAERLSALESVLRSEFGGQYTRLAKRGNAEREALHQRIREAYKGQPLRELARILGVHPSTVHRVLGKLRNEP